MSSDWPYAQLGGRFHWTPESTLLDVSVTHKTARLHDSLLETPAAVKVFTVPPSSDPETLALLPRLWKAEARSLLRLRASAHPGIVQVLAADYDAAAKAYFVAWEDNYAATLADLLAQRIPPPFRRLHDKIECCALLAQALLEMHSRGIVHRDIRPETICVWSDQRRVALSQFGQSIFLNSLLHGTRGTTGMTWPLALPPDSLRYTAPERCAYLTTGAGGLAGEGFPADIYSLGLVLSTWLLQKLPDETPFIAAGSYDPIAHAAWLKNHDTALEATTVSQDASIQEDLPRLLRDMIAFNARHRIRSAGDLVSRWVGLRNLSRQRLLDQSREGVLRLVVAENRVLEFSGPAIEAELAAIGEPLGTTDATRYAQARRVVAADLEHDVTIVPNAHVRGECLLIGQHFVYKCALFMEQRTQAPYQHLMMVQTILAGRPREPNWGAEVLVRNPVIRVVSLLEQGSPDHINQYKARKTDDRSWQQLLTDIRQAGESRAPDTGEATATSLDARASVGERRALTVAAFRQLLDVRRLDAALSTYAYRLVPDKDGETERNTDGDGDAFHVWVNAAPDVEDQRLSSEPAMEALASEFNSRFGLCHYLRSLAMNGKPQVALAPSHRGLTHSKIQAIVDDAGEDEDRVRLRVLGGRVVSIPTVGWIGPASAHSTDGQERAAVDRLSKDVFKLDLLDSPALTAVLMPGGLELSQEDERRLSPSKKECLTQAVSTYPVYVLKGPPGTGKTETVTALVRHIFSEDPSARVLVCAQSHRPLDNLVDRISKRMPDIAGLRFPTGEYEGNDRTSSLLPAVVRKGLTSGILSSCRRNSTHVQHWVDEIGASPDVLREILKDWIARIEQDPDELWEYFLRGASLVGVSCIGAHQLVRSNLPNFDWVIIEEAARAHATELLVPLTLGTRWFLLGDHDQLGPYRLNALTRALEAQVTFEANGGEHSSRVVVPPVAEKAKELSNLFVHLYKNAGTRQRGEIIECYRMHPELVRFVGRLFYEDENAKDRTRLVAAASAEDRRHPYRASWHKDDWLGSKQIVFLDTSTYLHRREVHDYDSSHANLLEADLVRELLKRLIAQQPAGDKDLESAFAVLTVYARQGAHLRRILQPLGAQTLVHTLMTYQGREARTVILSLVRSNAYRVPQQALGSISHDQDLNVALSRAQELLILVGDVSHFREYAAKVPRIGRLLELVQDSRIRMPTDLLAVDHRPEPLEALSKS